MLPRMKLIMKKLFNLFTKTKDIKINTKKTMINLKYLKINKNS